MDELDTPASAKGRQRICFLKKMIVCTIILAILIPVLTSISLGIQLHLAKRQLRELREQLQEAAAVDSGNVLTIPAPAESICMGADENMERYTADSVAVSKRDAAKGTQGEAAGETQGQTGDIHRVYLTFDDGPSGNTGRILDILAEYDVKATFFVVGKEEEEYQALYQRIVEEGHTLGMHSYSHRYQEIYQSLDSYVQDLTRLQEFLYSTTGVWCRYSRFPGGSSNSVSKVDMQELIAYLDEQDITYFDWNIASGDASSGYISTDAILNNCLTNIPKYEESIILMHDASDKNTTVQALPELIERIQAMDDAVIVPITEDTEPIQHISIE